MWSLKAPRRVLASGVSEENSELWLHAALNVQTAVSRPVPDRCPWGQKEPVSLGTHPRRGREEPPGRRCLGPPGYRQSCQGQLVGLSSLGSWGEQQKQKSLGNSEAAKLTYLFCCD